MNPLSFARRRIGVQLALALVIASVAPLIGAGWLVSGLMETSLLREARATQDTLLGASRSLVDGHVGGAEAKLNTIARMIVGEEYAVPLDDVKADAANRGALAQRLSGLLEPNDVFLELSYYSFERRKSPGENVSSRAQAVQQDYYKNYRNNDGPGQQYDEQQELPPGNSNQMQTANMFAIPGSADAAPMPLSDPLMKLARLGTSFVSESIQFAGPLAFLRMSVPVERDGKAIGALVASVNLEPLRGLLTSISARRGVVTLRDRDGATIASQGPDPGADALVGTLPADARGWTLAIREPRGAALATLADARRQSMIWFGGAAILALGFTVLFTSRIVGPVRKLTGAVERMSAGDLHARVPVGRDDEIGRLGNAFNEMARALEELDELKSDFVSHVSHELRTPLTSIKLSIANLEDGVIGPMDARQLEVLARVREDLDRLIKMVNGLLEVARLEAGKTDLARESCDLAAVVRVAAGTINALAALKGVRINVTGEAPAISADRSKIQQVVLNLIDNAVKFSPANEEVRVVIAAEKGGALVTVVDSGPGIDPLRLPRVFEKFAMIPSDGKPKPPGAGLGLSISRKIVELHGGWIEALNRSSGGAEFRVWLPGLLNKG